MHRKAGSEPGKQTGSRHQREEHHSEKTTLFSNLPDELHTTAIGYTAMPRIIEATAATASASNFHASRRCLPYIDFPA